MKYFNLILENRYIFRGLALGLIVLSIAISSYQGNNLSINIDNKRTMTEEDLKAVAKDLVVFEKVSK